MATPFEFDTTTRLPKRNLTPGTAGKVWMDRGRNGSGIFTTRFTDGWCTVGLRWGCGRAMCGVLPEWVGGAVAGDFGGGGGVVAGVQAVRDRAGLEAGAPPMVLSAGSVIAGRVIPGSEMSGAVVVVGASVEGGAVVGGAVVGGAVVGGLVVGGGAVVGGGHAAEATSVPLSGTATSAVSAPSTAMTAARDRQAGVGRLALMSPAPRT